MIFSTVSISSFAPTSRRIWEFVKKSIWWSKSNPPHSLLAQFTQICFPPSVNRRNRLAAESKRGCQFPCSVNSVILRPVKKRKRRIRFGKSHLDNVVLDDDIPVIQHVGPRQVVARSSQITCYFFQPESMQQVDAHSFFIFVSFSRNRPQKLNSKKGISRANWC